MKMKFKDIKNSLKKIWKSIKLNISLVLFFFLFIIAVLIAFPQFSFYLGEKKIAFDGIDISDISNNKYQSEFKFSPTTDFYGGVEIVLDYIDLSSTVDAEILNNEKILKNAVKKLDKRLKNIGIQNLEIYSRKSNEDKNEIILKLPGQEQKYSSILEFFQFQNIEFSKQVIPEKENEETLQLQQNTPQYINTELNAEDISSIDVIYGTDKELAETMGMTDPIFTFIIYFDEEKTNDLLLTALSDINQDQSSSLFLTVNNYPFGAQRYPVNSTQNSNEIRFIVYIEDVFTVRYIKDMLENPHLNQNLTVNRITTFEGRFDKIASQMKMISVLILGVIALLLIYKYRIKGVFIYLIFIFLIFSSIAVYKIFNLPILLVSILAFISAVLIWVINSRKIFKQILKNEIDEDQYLFILNNQTKNLLIYWIFSYTFFILLSNIGILVISNIFLYYIYALLVGLVTNVIGFRAILKLINK